MVTERNSFFNSDRNSFFGSGRNSRGFILPDEPIHYTENVFEGWTLTATAVIDTYSVSGGGPTLAPILVETQTASSSILLNDGMIKMMELAFRNLNGVPNIVQPWIVDDTSTQFHVDDNAALHPGWTLLGLQSNDGIGTNNPTIYTTDPDPVSVDIGYRNPGSTTSPGGIWSGNSVRRIGFGTPFIDFSRASAKGIAVFLPGTSILEYCAGLKFDAPFTKFGVSDVPAAHIAVPNMRAAFNYNVRRLKISISVP